MKWKELRAALIRDPKYLDPEPVLELEAGTYAIVTGDKGIMGHNRPTGDRVLLVRFDPLDNTWLVTYKMSNGALTMDTWVDQQDLMPADLPVSEREMKEAMKSIKKSARNLRRTR